MARGASARDEGRSPDAAAAPSGRGRGVGRRRLLPLSAEDRRGYGFVLPATIMLLLVLAFPIVVAVGTSFTSPHGGLTAGNYARLARSTAFLGSLTVTFVFVFATVVLHLLLGGAVAFALNAEIRGRRLWRVLMILPWTMPDVISGLVWKFMYDPTAGIINALLRQVGIIHGYIEWLGSSTLALASVIFADAWRGYPFVMLIILAGLQSTSRELSEAARVDGARWWQELWRVTLPQLRKVILVAVALDTIWQFRRFGLVYNMTGGGPGDATEILSLFIYKNYFKFFNYEYASAVAVTLAVIMLALSIPYVFSVVRRER
ncbi:MAG: carbohydrate ABC transporter permease [Streptosporangiaceae bacterium]